MPAENPTGCYSREFQLSAEWLASGRSRIIFDGVSSAFHLFCNGRWVGYSQDGRLTAEFDLTPYLQSGRNRLAVLLLRWPDGSYLEDQDIWWLSGIFCSVRLLHKPARHLMDIRVTPELDACYRDGRLKIALQAANVAAPHQWSAEMPHLYRLILTLLDEKGQAIESEAHDVGFRVDPWWADPWCQLS